MKPFLRNFIDIFFETLEGHNGPWPFVMLMSLGLTAYLTYAAFGPVMGAAAYVAASPVVWCAVCAVADTVEGGE